MLRSELQDKLSELMSAAGKACRIVPNEISAQTSTFDYERAAVIALIQRVSELSDEILSWL